MRIPFDVPPRATRACDVVGFGLNSVDLVAVVAEHPAPDSKQKLQRFARLPGGQTATALAACARLGFSARYIGSFGDDDLGALSRESLVQEGVDISAARTVPGATNQFSDSPRGCAHGRSEQCCGTGIRCSPWLLRTCRTMS